MQATYWVSKYPALHIQLLETFLDASQDVQLSLAVEHVLHL